MAADITDNNTNFSLAVIPHIQIVIVITTGSLTINALTRDIQAGKLGI
jgi:hypothetical protein